MRRAFLDLPDGVALRIGPAGLLLGRHRSCDLQLADETASRRHALLRLARDGVELVVLGKKPVHVNGRAVGDVAPLRDGDRVALPGLTAALRVVADPRDAAVAPAFLLRRGRDRFAISTSPFVVGTGAVANLVVAGWPEAALVFRVAQGELYVEAAAAGAELAGAPLEPDGVTQLHAGDAIGFGDDRVVVEPADAGAGDASTVMTAPGTARATAIALSALPRGGRVALAFPDGERAVYLPGRRFKLIGALASPPPPHVAGDFVPDSEVVPLVWDDDDEVGGRQDINVLLTRCRQDLVAAGIAATQLLERAPGGRATRLVLAPGARVTIAATE
jgi:pSer/pThr/pTyr-binding forkhead associated (FHA) protein